jgi:hypothetical protein
VLHLGGGQLGVLGQQAGQAGQVAAVEDGAAFDFELELGPAGEPVVAGWAEDRMIRPVTARMRAVASGSPRWAARSSSLA